MKKIPFQKYVLCGNKFVLLDETEKQLLSESEKSYFSYCATDGYFGINSDNLLVIQPCNEKKLSEINQARQYWKTLPDTSGADFIFRMFEPDGQEALCCGNGLTCIADYLFQQYGISRAGILTEIPNRSPRLLTIGTDAETQMNWTNIGRPRKIPASLVHPSFITHSASTLDELKKIPVDVRFGDFMCASTLTSVAVSGYLIYTGEPHLVIFTDSDIAPPLNGNIFRPAPSEGPASKLKVDSYTQFVHLIGMGINKDYSHQFPKGLNINFVRIPDAPGTIEYRCFERGLFRETWACGTGALASVYAAEQLNRIRGNSFDVWPYLCRKHHSDAALYVRKKDRDYYLYGQPQCIFSGLFDYQIP